MRALILTYHAIEDGPAPLCVDPALFAAQVECIVESDATAVTVSALAEGLRSGSLDKPLVAVTFDDGAASVARVAAPLLRARGVPATIFCVAGHLGGVNDWRTGRPGPAFELARADELAELADDGFEIGSHGMTHMPLGREGERFFQREVVDSRATLERVVGSPVRALAYPYGAAPTIQGFRLIERTYTSGWTTRAGYAHDRSDLFAMPRVDAYYLRRPDQLRSALDGQLSGYLLARNVFSRTRRIFKKDYLPL